MKNFNAVVVRADRNALTHVNQPMRHDRRNFARVRESVQLKQIDEFSPGHADKMQQGTFFSVGLVCFSIFCLSLFALGVDITVFFSVGAVIILVQLIKSWLEFSQEEMRARLAYQNYLNTFSYQALCGLRRTSPLSDWSKFEIDQYLAQYHA